MEVFVAAQASGRGTLEPKGSDVAATDLRSTDGANGCRLDGRE